MSGRGELVDKVENVVWSIIKTQKTLTYETPFALVKIAVAPHRVRYFNKADNIEEQ